MKTIPPLKFYLRRLSRILLAATLVFSHLTPPGFAQVGPVSSVNSLNLPVAGTMVRPTSGFGPAVLVGVKVHPDNPFRMDFIVDSGEDKLQGEELKVESTKLIKYFLASLTVPEDELWVNLSPYEKDRIIPEKFGITEMGRDLLAQDYLLKQLTASLIYPEDEPGKSFWDKIYQKAYELYGTTNIPINTFNKVWIIPDNAIVFENKDTAFVVESHLKVMLEGDYLALENNLNKENLGTNKLPQQDVQQLSDVSSQIVKDVVLPAIEKEINEGKNFAQLRQIYSGLILAAWYKKRLKESILTKVYADKNKVAGVDVEDKASKDKIYDQYVEAFKQGVYNYIKSDEDPHTGKTLKRRYVSGGFTAGKFSKDGLKVVDKAELSSSPALKQKVNHRLWKLFAPAMFVSALISPFTQNPANAQNQSFPLQLLQNRKEEGRPGGRKGESHQPPGAWNSGNSPGSSMSFLLAGPVSVPDLSSRQNVGDQTDARDLQIPVADVEESADSIKVKLDWRVVTDEFNGESLPVHHFSRSRKFQVSGGEILQIDMYRAEKSDESKLTNIDSLDVLGEKKVPLNKTILIYVPSSGGQKEVVYYMFTPWGSLQRIRGGRDIGQQPWREAAERMAFRWKNSTFGTQGDFYYDFSSGIADQFKRTVLTVNWYDGTLAGVKAKYDGWAYGLEKEYEELLEQINNARGEDRYFAPYQEAQELKELISLVRQYPYRTRFLLDIQLPEMIHALHENAKSEFPIKSTDLEWLLTVFAQNVIEIKEEINSLKESGLDVQEEDRVLQAMRPYIKLILEMSGKSESKFRAIFMRLKSLKPYSPPMRLNNPQPNETKPQSDYWGPPMGENARPNGAPGHDYYSMNPNGAMPQGEGHPTVGIEEYLQDRRQNVEDEAELKTAPGKKIGFISADSVHNAIQQAANANLLRVDNAVREELRALLDDPRIFEVLGENGIDLFELDAFLNNVEFISVGNADNDPPALVLESDRDYQLTYVDMTNRIVYMGAGIRGVLAEAEDLFEEPFYGILCLVELIKIWKYEESNMDQSPQAAWKEAEKLGAEIESKLVRGTVNDYIYLGIVRYLSQKNKKVSPAQIVKLVTLLFANESVGLMEDYGVNESEYNLIAAQLLDIISKEEVFYMAIKDAAIRFFVLTMDSKIFTDGIKKAAGDYKLKLEVSETRPDKLIELLKQIEGEILKYIAQSNDILESMSVLGGFVEEIVSDRNPDYERYVEFSRKFDNLWDVTNARKDLPANINIVFDTLMDSFLMLLIRDGDDIHLKVFLSMLLSHLHQVDDDSRKESLGGVLNYLLYSVGLKTETSRKGAMNSTIMDAARYLPKEIVQSAFEGLKIFLRPEGDDYAVAIKTTDWTLDAFAGERDLLKGLPPGGSSNLEIDNFVYRVAQSMTAQGVNGIVIRENFIHKANGSEERRSCSIVIPGEGGGAEVVVVSKPGKRLSVQIAGEPNLKSVLGVVPQNVRYALQDHPSGFDFAIDLDVLADDAVEVPRGMSLETFLNQRRQENTKLTDDQVRFVVAMVMAREGYPAQALEILNDEAAPEIKPATVRRFREYFGRNAFDFIGNESVLGRMADVWLRLKREPGYQEEFKERYFGLSTNTRDDPTSITIYSKNSQAALDNIIGHDIAKLDIDSVENPGGIDFDPAKIDMRFEGDEVIFAPPADPQSWEHIPFDGLDLRILNVTPVSPASLPMVLGISDIRETQKAGIRSL